MATDPPAPGPGWFSRAFGFVKGVGGNVLELARITFGGDATGGRIVFFSVGLLGLVCLATLPLFAVRDQMTHLLISFGILAVVVLVLVCRIAWRLDAPPAAGADPAALADLAQARAERDRANEHLVIRTTESAAAAQQLATRTTELAAAAQQAGALTAELRGTLGQVQALTAERDESRDWLRELYARCGQIYRQIRKDPLPYPAVLSDVCDFTIEADGTMVAAQTVSLKPVGGKLQMILRELGSDAPARSVRDLQITPSATRLSGAEQQVVVLPAVDEEQQKKVLLVFLPEVPAKAQVEYAFCWRWANLWQRLLDTGRDSWEATMQSSEAVPEVKFLFRVSPQLVARFPLLQLANTGSGGGWAEGPEVDERGYTVYTWVANYVPPGATMKIVLSRADY